ncbi:MAG: glycosyltransferase [Anaerolineales bacterium]|nr:glycosyltransferase [Anaerolineales bacterium]
MHIALLNPQGNFDPLDSRWTEHPDFGGQLVYVKEIAVSLAALGHQVDILTRQILDPEWTEFQAPYDSYPEVKGVRIVRIPCGPEQFLPKEHLWQYLGTEWVPNILNFFQKEGSVPEVFSAHYGDGGLSAVLLSQQTNTPITFTGHSLGAQKIDKLLVSNENLSDLDRQHGFSLRISAERVAMNHADRIITSTYQERIQQYGHSAYAGAVDVRATETFEVIPPGVNLEVFSEKEGKLDLVIEERIKAYLQKDILPERRKLPVALASSRLDAKKNLTGLVRAFGMSQTLQSKSNLALVVRGVENPFQNAVSLSSTEQAIMDEITALIEEYSLQGKITAFPLNSQQELAAAYRRLSQRLSVFVLPALYEPFGLAPLEAMSCGLPAVVTRHGGPSESLEEGGRVFAKLVDPEDPAELAGGILSLVESKTLWQRYRDAGRERVLEKYTWQATARGYERVFEAIVVAGHQPGELPIPSWYTDPLEENKPGIKDLQAIYF